MNRICTLVTASLCSAFFLPSSHAELSLSFLAIGDSGTGTKTQIAVAEAMADYAQKFRGSNMPSFTLVLGDNFYPRGVTGPDDPQWQQKFERMYDERRLPMPFLAVLGNHDWRGDSSDAEIDYAKTHPRSRWKMDGHWYKRRFLIDPGDPKSGADFFFVDSGLWDEADPHVVKYNPPGKMGAAQMDWLQDELRKSDALWKFVVAHQPVYSNGHHGHDRDVLELRRRLGPLLEKYNVDAYISGHDHDLQRIEVPNVPTLFLISGAAGTLRPQAFDDWKPFYQSTPGFLSVQISASQMHGRFIDAQGKILDAWSRPRLPKNAR